MPSLSRHNSRAPTFYKAQLQGAGLIEAQLQDAIFIEAQLQGAFLIGASNLTQIQIDTACVDKYTQLPRGLTKPSLSLASCPALTKPPPCPLQLPQP